MPLKNIEWQFCYSIFFFKKIAFLIIHTKINMGTYQGGPKDETSIISQNRVCIKSKHVRNISYM